MSNDGLEQPHVTERTMVHEENGLFYDKDERENTLITKARFDKIFTVVRCDKESITKALQGILTPGLICSLQTSNVCQWKKLGFLQCLVILHHPDYDCNNCNTVVLCIHTKNYDVLHTLLQCTSCNTDNMIRQITRLCHTSSPESAWSRLVQQHELLCRILQNTHFIVDQCKEQMHHQKSINEHTQSIVNLRKSQDEFRTVFNDFRNQQQHMQDALYNVQNALTQHTEDFQKPMVELCALEARADDIETRMTAQASVGEMHEDRLDEMQLMVESLKTNLYVVQEKQATLLETLDADLNARCAWSSELMIRIHECEQGAIATRDKHQAVLNSIQQLKTFAYVVLVGVMFYPFICFFFNV